MGAFDDALERLTEFAGADQLTARIAELEFDLERAAAEDVPHRLREDGIDELLLGAALDVKRVAGQINVIVHAIGILVSLPYVLEPGEVIQSLSLGAGNTGRSHDLETDLRIAETGVDPPELAVRGSLQPGERRHREAPGALRRR